MNILDRYKNEALTKLQKRASKLCQRQDFAFLLTKIGYNLVSFVSGISVYKALIDETLKSGNQFKDYLRKHGKNTFLYCDGKNIKHPYREDFLSLDEKDQAVILERQYETSQEQKQIAAELKSFFNSYEKMIKKAAQYEESRESITTSLIYSIFLDKYSKNTKKLDVAYNDFLEFREYLRFLKFKPEKSDNTENNSDEAKEIERAENAETDKASEVTSNTFIGAKTSTLSTECILNSLNVLKTAEYSALNAQFFDSLLDDLSRDYEKYLIELSYNTLVEILQSYGEDVSKFFESESEILSIIKSDSSNIIEICKILNDSAELSQYKENSERFEQFSNTLEDLTATYSQLTTLVEEINSQKEVATTAQPEFKKILSHFIQFNEQQLAEISMLLDQNQHGMSYIKSLVEYDFASSISDFDELKNTLASLSVKSQKNHQI